MSTKTQKQRMLAGELYMANDPELAEAYARAQAVLTEFNATRGDDLPALRHLLATLLGHLGENAIVKPAFRCDYGLNISIGARSFVNYDCVMLDCNKITIGEEVQIGPGVHIYTATHPLDAPTRRSGLEAAHPVTIGNGVWLGGRSVVCPGVTVGDNTVVGAGSVVTKDLPAGILAVGSPCRVVRAL
jgi:maltose O-acetyltransferase